MSANLERFKAIIERGFSNEHQYLTKADLPGPQILKGQIDDARRSIKDLKLTIEATVESDDTV